MNRFVAIVILVVGPGMVVGLATAADRPNVLWLTSEDHGPEMGCYGDRVARTPHVDELAARGLAFDRVWSVAPVCAPARTALITGMYPSSIGALHMRSMVSLPTHIKLLPQLLREAGYYCSNNSKEDYNVRVQGPVWDTSSVRSSWRTRQANQPFFAVFNSTKSHESRIRVRPHTLVTHPEAIRLPVYHPDTPEVRADWAQYYDRVSEADADAGAWLKELHADGLADDTIVFYFADHGSGMPRSKRWPGNSGLHVPLIVYFPPRWQQLAPREYREGGRSDRSVSFVDMAPTVLSLAGVRPPDWMQGHAFAGKFQSVSTSDLLHGERGRMDERLDLSRSITDGRFVYIRNFYPQFSHGQRIAYQFETPTTRIWNELYKSGRATAPQAMFWTVPKPVEELYDLTNDRDEVHNLADSAAHQTVVDRFRAAQEDHLRRVRDICFLPEAEMHARSDGSTPYDIAHNEKMYPFEQILAIANLASRGNAADRDELTRCLADPDSGVRYWAAIGLLIQGREPVQRATVGLERALEDRSPSVRIAAAQALAAYGSTESVERALNTLGSLALPEQHGVLVSMAALATIETLGSKASRLHPTIISMSQLGNSPDSRFSPYIPRLVENIRLGLRNEP